nr:NADH dehydrogenase subunit 2 [Mycomya sp. WQY006]
MIKNSSKFIFLFSMILGTMITISANSWLSIWMGLEINLLSFIPLMIDSKNLMSTEASLKYFLTQAFASSILLLSMILFMMTKNFFIQLDLSMNYLLMLIFLTLMIKSGMAPFHFWFPNVMEGISWFNGLLLMTWQKIAPMVIMSYFFIFNYFFMFIIFSVIIGAIGGLNQSSIRKIMAFSSINHLGWMLTAMMFNEYTWMFYFLIYSLISFSLILMFNLFKLFYLNQMFTFFSHSTMMKFILLTSLLSLGGLPPFLGFLPKWIVIQSLIYNNQYFLIMIMIFMSLITMYFYLRICYSAFMLNYTEQNWNYSNFINNSMFNINQFFFFISIFGITMILYITYSLY